jgi:glycosyltransferase involved in cell wall biosynthesis
MSFYKLPTISFIVPVYNVEQYVAQCIESIISQIDVFPGSEIIVVNDGTKDNSMTVVKRIVDNRPDVRVINQENQGLSVARNHGVTEAKGDYIWLIDSDDWLEGDALSVLKEAMLDSPNMDLYVTGLNWTYPGGRISKDIVEDKHPIYDNKAYANMPFPRGASQRFVQKRKFIQNAKLMFIPGIIHEDGPYGVMLIYLASSIKILPKCVYGYRQREGGIMSTRTIRSAYDCITGHRALMEFWETSVKDEDRVWFRKYAFSMIHAAFSFSEHLIDEPEFEEFIKKEWNYISNETKNIRPYVSVEKKIQLTMFLSNPAVYYKYIKPLVGPFVTYLTRRK